MDDNLKLKIDEAAKVADEFIKLYYESVDKKRHLMNKLYLDRAKLVWCGNGIIGNAQIQNFFNELPISDHTISSLDAQPIIDPAVVGQLTIIIQTSGSVRFQDKKTSFQQSFMITAIAGKWKIVTDCFRLQEGI